MHLELRGEVLLEDWISRHPLNQSPRTQLSWALKPSGCRRESEGLVSQCWTLPLRGHMAAGLVVSWKTQCVLHIWECSPPDLLLVGSMWWITRPQRPKTPLVRKRSTEEDFFSSRTWWTQCHDYLLEESFRPHVRKFRGRGCWESQTSGHLGKANKRLSPFLCISLPMLLPPGKLDIFCGLCKATHTGLECIVSWALTICSFPLIHGFRICDFAYSLTFFCNPEINTPGTVAVFMDMHRAAQIWLTHSVCSHLMLCLLVSTLVLQTRVLSTV